MKTIDARGEICPKPLIMAKKGLLIAQIDEIFAILIDNETSKENVERFLEENSVQCITTFRDGIYELRVTKGSAELLHSDVDEFCHISTGSKDVGSTTGDLIIMNKDAVGVGPDELTALLVKGFFTTIREVEVPPYGIVFYNSGIKLALKDSAVIDDIKVIAAKGCKILVCGTCIDHYDVKDQVAIGTISNMYDILGLMQKATKVFTP